MPGSVSESLSPVSPGARVTVGIWVGVTDGLVVAVVVTVGEVQTIVPQEQESRPSK